MPAIRTPLIGIVAALGLAACGGSSSSSSTAASTSSAPAATSSSSASAPSGGGNSISESADPSGALKFTKSTLTAKAGKVTIKFSNTAPEMHNMTIASASGGQVGATPTFEGGTKTLTVNLKPGKYVFYCSVPGHRQGGMQGTLTVS